MKEIQSHADRHLGESISGTWIRGGYEPFTPIALGESGSATWIREGMNPLPPIAQSLAQSLTAIV
jgi:hypothetical protein